jgi:hypothetical protein
MSKFKLKAKFQITFEAVTLNVDWPGITGWVRFKYRS